MKLTAEDIAKRDQAKAIVDAKIANSPLTKSDWKQSGGREWEVAVVGDGEKLLRIGASTGGVISINGDPFTLEERKLINNSYHFAIALNEHLSRF